MQDWPDAAAAIDAELPYLSRGQVPDAPTRRLLLNLATALTLARDEPGLARIRGLYGAGMDKTADGKAFTLLTSPPEHGILNYQAIPAMISQVEGFQNFMNDWQKKVKKGGLSSLN
jgi:hypothetical protein